MKVRVLFVFVLFLYSCSIFEYLRKENLVEIAENSTVREFDLSYQQKIFGIKVKGDKSIVEGIFLHPDKKTLFMPISFPKIGILKTDDYGKTISASFFSAQGLEEFFGYIDEEESFKKDQKKKVQKRIWTNFNYSPVDYNKIVLSFGEYIFLSTDKGNKWKVKKIFYDIDKSNIIDIFITNREEIILITENKICRSYDWGKSWKYDYIRVNGINSFRLRYVAGFYDNSSDTLYASIIDNSEKDFFLSLISYNFFYKNEKVDLKSALFVSKDLGKNFKRTSLIPLILWKYRERIYGCSPFTFSLYNYSFSEAFLNSNIVKTCKLDSNNQLFKEYIQYLENISPMDLDIVSLKNNRILTISDDGNSYQIIEENDFENIYSANKRLESLQYLNWDENWQDRKISNNFFYEYSPYHIFKIWTGMRTNSPNLYLKSENIYYRVTPDKRFWKIFVRYAIEKSINLSKINPFLKGVNDIEFFEPSLDPTLGFPVIIEYSLDNGNSWESLIDSSYVVNIIDPLKVKRSGFYWYKNVEQKRTFRLQISFGFDQGINYLVYPHSITLLENDIAILLNYFTINESYKDLYLILVKRKDF